MWLLLAFLSATLLGFYDVFKKKSLKDNAVLPVLFLNTFFSSLIFLPFILISVYQPDLLGGTIFNVPVAGWEQHKYIIIKSFIHRWLGVHRQPANQTRIHLTPPEFFTLHHAVLCAYAVLAVISNCYPPV